MILNPNERLDFVNDNLSLIQDLDGLTFGTDALLLSGYVNKKYNNGLELGGGSGIISMLLLTRQKAGRMSCVEIQESYYELIRRNAELNRLEDRLFPILADARSFRSEVEFDLIVSNPPYMKNGSGRSCENEKKHVARHEVYGDIFDFLKCASANLKYGGSLYLVYRPDRLCDLFVAMRNCGIEPKRSTFVHSTKDAVPSMVLVEGKKGGRSGMKLTCPLIIYNEKGSSEYSPDMNYVMNNGSFPAKFGK